MQVRISIDHGKLMMWKGWAYFLDGTYTNGIVFHRIRKKHVKKRVRKCLERSGRGYIRGPRFMNKAFAVDSSTSQVRLFVLKYPKPPNSLRVTSPFWRRINPSGNNQWSSSGSQSLLEEATDLDGYCRESFWGTEILYLLDGNKEEILRFL